MATSWFICPYKRTPNTRVPQRYCAMDDFTPQILADGGDWSESEVLGGYALVKVRASDITLTLIAGTAGFQRIPNSLRLTDTLGSLTNGQLNAINNQLLAMGYTQSEITAALGNNFKSRTLGQVLRFAASRRLKPRYDTISDAIVLDGPVQTCKLVDDVDSEVQD